MFSYIVGFALWGLVAAADTQGSSRDAALELAKAALTHEVGASAESLEPIDVAEAVWRDSSLGCPERGTVYTPMMTSGHRVTLSFRGARYVVHVGQGRAVVCRGPAGSRGRVLSPPPGSADPADAKTAPTSAIAGLKLAEQARDDLAKTLSVEKGQVTINFFRPATWPDAGLGCPAEGQVYPKRLTKGFIIELASGGKTYEYHSDMNRVVPCDSPSPESQHP
jgi:hypothetical protein